MTCAEIESQKQLIRDEWTKIVKQITIQNDSIELLKGIQKDVDDLKGEATRGTIFSAINAVTDFIIGVYDLSGLRAKAVKKILSPKLSTKQVVDKVTLWEDITNLEKWIEYRDSTLFEIVVNEILEETIVNRVKEIIDNVRRFTQWEQARVEISRQLQDIESEINRWNSKLNTNLDEIRNLQLFYEYIDEYQKRYCHENQVIQNSLLSASFISQEKEEDFTTYSAMYLADGQSVQNVAIFNEIKTASETALEQIKNGMGKQSASYILQRELNKFLPEISSNQIENAIDILLISTKERFFMDAIDENRVIKNIEQAFSYGSFITQDGLNIDFEENLTSLLGQSINTEVEEVLDQLISTNGAFREIVDLYDDIENVLDDVDKLTDGFNQFYDHVINADSPNFIGGLQAGSMVLGTLSKYVGGDFGDDLQKAAELASTASQLMTLFSVFTGGTGAIATLGFGQYMGALSAFTGMGNSGNDRINRMILGIVKKTLKEVREMRQEMNARFDELERKLDDFVNSTETNFDVVFAELDDIKDNLKLLENNQFRIIGNINNISGQISEVDFQEAFRNFTDTFDDVFRYDGIWVECNISPIPLKKDCINRDILEIKWYEFEESPQLLKEKFRSFSKWSRLSSRKFIKYIHTDLQGAEKDEVLVKAFETIFRFNQMLSYHAPNCTNDFNPYIWLQGVHAMLLILRDSRFDAEGEFLNDQIRDNIRIGKKLLLQYKCLRKTEFDNNNFEIIENEIVTYQEVSKTFYNKFYDKLKDVNGFEGFDFVKSTPGPQYTWLSTDHYKHLRALLKGQNSPEFNTNLVPDFDWNQFSGNIQFGLSLDLIPISVFIEHSSAHIDQRIIRGEHIYNDIYAIRIIYRIKHELAIKLKIGGIEIAKYSFEKPDKVFTDGFSNERVALEKEELHKRAWNKFKRDGKIDLTTYNQTSFSKIEANEAIIDDKMKEAILEWKQDTLESKNEEIALYVSMAANAMLIKRQILINTFAVGMGNLFDKNPVLIDLMRQLPSDWNTIKDRMVALEFDSLELELLQLPDQIVEHAKKVHADFREIENDNSIRYNVTKEERFIYDYIKELEFYQGEIQR